MKVSLGKIQQRKDEATFENGFSLGASSSSSSFTRNKFLPRSIPSNYDFEEHEQKKRNSLKPLVGSLNPNEQQSSNFQIMRKSSNFEANNISSTPKKSKKIAFYNDGKLVSGKSRTSSQESNSSLEDDERNSSSFSSSEDDDEFIRAQEQARVEYRGTDEEDLKPTPSMSLPLGLNLNENSCFEFPTSFDELALDPNLMALEEYLSEAKLRAATGENNLHNVKHLEIIVNTTNNSLGDIGGKLCNLEELKLNGSTIPSIRDLGTSLKNIRILWLSRCGIKELDGISTFSKLRELYLSYNDIDDISDLAGMEELEILDLEGNNIDDESQLVYLQDCRRLTSLTLSGNPMLVKLSGKYRSSVRETLPTLEYLDDLSLASSDDSVGRGVSPIKKEEAIPSLEDLENEFEMLKKSIKLTKVESLDEGLSENPLILTISTRLYNPADNNMIRNITATTPRLDGGRPQSASFFRRPSTSSSLARSMTRSRMGMRPTTSQGRPITAMSLSQSRPMTASSMMLNRPMTASSEKQNIPTTILQSKKDENEDASSHLTFKATDVFCGNIAKGLKKKKKEEPLFLAHAGPVELDILAEVQKHKLNTLDEPNEELEEFLNEVYDGLEVLETPFDDERPSKMVSQQDKKKKPKAELRAQYDDIDEDNQSKGRRNKR
ncbi:hypothetical protein C9374_008088 [Naegleria lovaniensis]|uniref:Uncharacterized protein n=1 Tax=Naegleria lovaniensis TaxID=51637 RepID=A0AA88KL35_NAELO|nr:uncharacterized protein C9374_008088 [Naegleria lovaniensis]KAG2378449.1 hypothetical protein C9374_008088 [Naegleria lovaniensis]